LTWENHLLDRLWEAGWLQMQSLGSVLSSVPPENITTDVEQFLKAPRLPAGLDSDVAVPYTPRASDMDGIGALILRV
jgi:hypothetical protein